MPERRPAPACGCAATATRSCCPCATRAAGMGRDEQRRLFEPFQSAEPHGHRPRPGHRLPDRARAPRRHHRAQRALAGGPQVDVRLPVVPRSGPGRGVRRMPKKRILVVDDEPSMRELLAIMLKKEGFEVVTAESRAMAAAVLAQGPVDLVITDVRLPDGDGIEILRHVKAASPETVGHRDDRLRHHRDRGGRPEARRPRLHPEALRRRRAARSWSATPCERQDLREENLLLKRELGRAHGLDQVIGVSPAMIALFEMIRSIAPTSSTVLVTGESGTGKELVAQAIHALSPRRDGALRLRQLRRPAGHPARERALRPHEGRLHRRPPEQEGPLRGRPPGDALPRRGRGDLAVHAGQAAAGAAGADDPAGRRHRRGRGRRARDLGHQRPPGATGPASGASARTSSIACR